MAGEIKLFLTIQKFYKTMGLNIHSTQLCQSKCLPSAKRLLLLISSAQLLVSSAAFLLFEAKTTIEYAISFYISITILSVMVDITTVLWKIKKIVELIGKYEEFLAKS